MDAEIVHANGLGSPCSTRSILGGACGFAGHGVLFPAFNAGFLYSTPSLAGLQFTLGLYDPSVNSERAYEIHAVPPARSAASPTTCAAYFKLFGEAMSQRRLNAPTRSWTRWATRCWTRAADRRGRLPTRTAYPPALRCRSVLCSWAARSIRDGPDLDCSDLQHPNLPPTKTKSCARDKGSPAWPRSRSGARRSPAARACLN